MKPLFIGKVEKSSAIAKKQANSIIEDFRQVRTTVEQMGLFQPSIAFYVLTMVHIVLLDAAGWAIMWYFGTGWIPYTAAALCLVTAQVISILFYFKVG